MIRQRDLLFELMKSEADKLYYVIKDGKKAERAAIIIISSPLGHFPKRRGDKYTLWFGYGIERWSFRTMKESEEKAHQILSTAKHPISVEIQDRYGKKKIKSYGSLLKNGDWRRIRG